MLVGGMSTVIDMVALLLLTRAGLALFWANMASTTIALAFSFAVNRRVTFKPVPGKPVWRQAVEFVVVTLVGLWLIQPPIIAGVQGLIEPLSLGHDVELLVGKGAATAVTMVWNYVLYSRLVFASGRRKVGAR